MIANVENSAAGFGVTGDIADAILGYGVDVMTSGNHIWDKKEVLDYIPRQPKLLARRTFRPASPAAAASSAARAPASRSASLNLMGRIFMTPLDDPFALALREVEDLRAKARVIFVDFHAEATSEKVAMGWHLDGRVTAVVGTHTHVQTADERMLPKGTACITDAGMTGPHDSIIGVTVEAALGRFVTACRRSSRPRPAPAGSTPSIVTADPATGKAIAIERLNLSAAEVEVLAASQAAPRAADAHVRSLLAAVRETTGRPAAPVPPERRVVR